MDVVQVATNGNVFVRLRIYDTNGSERKILSYEIPPPGLVRGRMCIL